MKALGPLPLRSGPTWNPCLTRKGLNKPRWSNGNGIFRTIANLAPEASRFYTQRRPQRPLRGSKAATSVKPSFTEVFLSALRGHRWPGCALSWWGPLGSSGHRPQGHAWKADCSQGGPAQWSERKTTPSPWALLLRNRQVTFLLSLGPLPLA